MSLNNTYRPAGKYTGPSAQRMRWRCAQRPWYPRSPGTRFVRQWREQLDALLLANAEKPARERLTNALPGVEKQTKFGDRGALIERLWSAIEALPEPEPQSDAKRPSKQEEGHCVPNLMAAPAVARG
jgi:hypothetical protein